MGSRTRGHGPVFTFHGRSVPDGVDVGWMPAAWRQLNPWNPLRRRPPIEEGAAEATASLGIGLEALRSEGREARLRAARRSLAQLLRAKGYRLHEIGEVIGREEAAISRLLLRARGCEEGEAEYWPASVAA
jgi:hypothetical protein